MTLAPTQNLHEGVLRDEQLYRQKLAEQAQLASKS